jgi:hypothetical protein
LQAFDFLCNPVSFGHTELLGRKNNRANLL